MAVSDEEKTSAAQRAGPGPGSGRPCRHGRPARHSGAKPGRNLCHDNIHKGLDILNNKSLSVEQRRSQFEDFLLGLTDMRRIADFTLGQYRRNLSPTDLAALMRRSKIMRWRSINPISRNMPARR